jgi:hypothetical protein
MITIRGFLSEEEGPNLSVILEAVKQSDLTQSQRPTLIHPSLAGFSLPLSIQPKFFPTVNDLLTNNSSLQFENIKAFSLCLVHLYNCQLGSGLWNV